MSERRQFHRKKIRTVGYVRKTGSGESEFHVQDLSIDGLRVYFNGDPLLEQGSTVYIRVPSLNIEGFAVLVRLQSLGRGRYEGGFYFDVSTMRNTLPSSISLTSKGEDTIEIEGGKFRYFIRSLLKLFRKG